MSKFQVVTAVATAAFLCCAGGYAEAQTYTVLHAFTGLSDGAYPQGGVVLDNAGMIYGTTSGQGSSGSTVSSGTIFSSDMAGNLVTLHSFDGQDGLYPQQTMSLVENALYGNTQLGGPANCGVIFSINTDGSGYTVLHAFSGKDGCWPSGTVSHVPGGGFAGVTSIGGPGYSSSDYGNGVLFYIGRNGGFHTLHNFSSSGDGHGPNSVLVDSAGNLFGATNAGGATCTKTRGGCGVIFSYNLTTRQYSILYDFTNGLDGKDPILGSIGSDGTLYGVTQTGRGFATYGSLFALKPSGAGYKLDTLAYTTTSLLSPTSGPTLTMPRGILIGAASLGIYAYDGGPRKILHSFTGGADGGFPEGQPAVGPGGIVVGTASGGGIVPCLGNTYPTGCGVLYEYTAK